MAKASAKAHGLQYKDAGERMVDVALQDYDAGVVAEIAVKNLTRKGFCVIDAGLEKELLDKALEDVGNLETSERFYQPPSLILDGLLGDRGSARIAHLQRPGSDASTSDGEHLGALDMLMSELGECLAPEVWHMHFSMSARTPAVVHESGEAPKELKDLTETEASEWMVQLFRAKIMCLVVLGPDSGTLHMKPFDNTETFSIQTAPGEVILLRADAMYHQHTTNGRSLVLTSFFLGEAALASKHTDVEDLHLTPIANALYDWVDNHLGVLKSKEEADDELPDAPAEWVRAMNHAYFHGQRHIVQDAVVRIPSTHDVSCFLGTLASGPDLVSAVPVVRWDHSVFFHPDCAEEDWLQRKTYCRHGGFCEGLELFDNKAFSLSPAESKGMDPMDRWVLECGYEVLVKAKYKRKDLMGSYGGVYMASQPSSYGDVGEVTGMSGQCIVANRFSFCLGMKGPSYNPDLGGASGLVVINNACQGMSERGTMIQCPFALVGGISLYFTQRHMIIYQGFGMMSRAGRCFSFDQSADGFVLSDAIGCLAMKPTPKVKDEDEPSPFGTVCSTIVNHNGRMSAGAPSGPAMLELLDLGLRNAGLEPLDIDAIAGHCEGVYNHDAIEVKAMTKAMNPEDVPAMWAMNGLMSTYGLAISATGTVNAIKTMHAIRYSCHQPVAHTRLKADILCDDDAENCLITTEALEFRSRCAYVGCIGYGVGGTNAYVGLWGKMDKDVHYADPHLGAKASEKIRYWPAGGGGLDPALQPRRDYYIVGTMTNWEPVVMRPGSNGQFTYQMNLGENRWEKFQIWLDGDKTRRLHPGKGIHSCIGPENVDGSSCWWINGRPGVHVHDGHEEITTPDTGLIGTKYTIALRITGKYRSVEWARLEPSDKDKQAIESAPLKGSEANYFLSPAWMGHHDLEKMEKDPSVPGRYFIDIRLPVSFNAFQIVREGDWDQVIYPRDPEAGPDVPVCGPDHMSADLYWLLHSHPGETYRISFVRTSQAGLDSMKVSWERLDDLNNYG